MVGIPLNGGMILNYETVNSVKKDGFQASCVSQCCNGIRKAHKGYEWQFELNIETKSEEELNSLLNEWGK